MLSAVCSELRVRETLQQQFTVLVVLSPAFVGKTLCNKNQHSVLQITSTGNLQQHVNIHSMPSTSFIANRLVASTCP